MLYPVWKCLAYETVQSLYYLTYPFLIPFLLTGQSAQITTLWGLHTVFHSNLRQVLPRWSRIVIVNSWYSRYFDLYLHVWLTFSNNSKYSVGVISTWSWYWLDPLHNWQVEQKPGGRGREWATLGVHPLSWLLSNNRLEKVPFVSVPHTSSNWLLLSNQDKGCTPSVALPLGPALLNLWTVFDLEWKRRVGSNYLYPTLGTVSTSTCIFKLWHCDILVKSTGLMIIRFLAKYNIDRSFGVNPIIIIMIVIIKYIHRTHKSARKRSWCMSSTEISSKIQ